MGIKDTSEIAKMENAIINHFPTGLPHIVVFELGTNMRNMNNNEYYVFFSENDRVTCNSYSSIEEAEEFYKKIKGKGYKAFVLYGDMIH